MLLVITKIYFLYPPALAWLWLTPKRKRERDQPQPSATTFTAKNYQSRISRFCCQVGLLFVARLAAWVRFVVAALLPLRSLGRGCGFLFGVFFFWPGRGGLGLGLALVGAWCCLGLVCSFRLVRLFVPPLCCLGGRVGFGSLVRLFWGRFPFSCFSVLCAVASSPLFFVWRFFSCLFLAVGLAFGAVLRYTGVVPSLGGLSRVFFLLFLSVFCSSSLLCVWSGCLPWRSVLVCAPFSPLFLWLGGGCLFCWFASGSAVCAGLLPCFLASVLCGAVLSGGFLGFRSRCASGWWRFFSFSGSLWFWRWRFCSFLSFWPSCSRGFGFVLCPCRWVFGFPFGRSLGSPLRSGWRSRFLCPLGFGGVRPWGRFRRPVFLRFVSRSLGLLGFGSRSRCVCGAFCCLGSCRCRRVGLPLRFPRSRLPLWCGAVPVVLRWRLRFLGFGCLGCRAWRSRFPVAALWGCRSLLAFSLGRRLVCLRPCWPSAFLVWLVRLFSPPRGGGCFFPQQNPLSPCRERGVANKKIFFLQS